MCRRKLIFSSSLLCWLVIKRELLVAKYSFFHLTCKWKGHQKCSLTSGLNQTASQPQTWFTCIYAHKDKYLAFRLLLRVRHITFYIPSMFLKINLTQLENKQWASKSLVSEKRWQRHCWCFLSTVTVISDVWRVKSVEEQNPSLPIIYVREKRRKTHIKVIRLQMIFLTGPSSVRVLSYWVVLA